MVYGVSADVEYVESVDEGAADDSEDAGDDALIWAGSGVEGSGAGVGISYE